MVAVNKKISPEEFNLQDTFIKEGALITISGTAFDVVGKLGMAIGTTGLLFYIFGMLEVMIGFGVVYSGAAIIAAGLVSAAIASKLKTGSWIKGIFG